MTSQARNGSDSIMYLGIDTGGTFTDFVLYDGQRLRIHKVLSTPLAPEQAILTGLHELGLTEEHRPLQLIHGSTVATNAVLEGKGVRTAFITNRGLKDLLTIGRQARRALYQLQPAPQMPPVAAELCLESGGRHAADGTLLEPLTDADLAHLRAELERLAPQAVAINLLYSYVDDRQERAIADMVPPGIFVSRSSEVLPEYKEYERGIATWLNAWVGPIVQGYLQRLSAALPAVNIAVMQSSGDTLSAALASGQAVRMLLSGPAGGLAGARYLGRCVGHRRLLTFDMGGTSTDVALIDGDIRLTGEGTIGTYPVAVPMVDMHTIGAGGGSIARLDAGGLLQVGPESAGAAPGPACYGRGGTLPTVTDANLVLGRLRPDAFLGGTMTLDTQAARAAVGSIALALNLGIEETALGIVRVANEHMAQALRVISVQRGINPRDYTLLSFGGAGGLHVCALADALGMRAALAPVHAGVLSALGMLAAPRGRRLSRTVNMDLDEVDRATLEQVYAELEAQGRAALRAEGLADSAIHSERAVDARYRGQSYTLTVAWQGASTAAEFHQAHQARYGHRLDLPVELVNARISVRGDLPPLQLSPQLQAPAQPPAHCALYGVQGAVPIHRREQLSVDVNIAGPALIIDAVSTTYVAAGWHGSVDEYANVLLQRA